MSASDLQGTFDNDPVVDDLPDAGKPVAKPALPGYLAQSAAGAEGIVVRPLDPTAESFTVNPPPEPRANLMTGSPPSAPARPRQPSSGANQAVLEKVQQLIEALATIEERLDAKAPVLADSIAASAIGKIQNANIDMEPLARAFATKAQASIDAKRFGSEVTEAVKEGIITRLARTPLVLGVAVVVVVAAIIGCLIGMKIESAMLADGYTERVQGLSYLPSAMHSRAGTDIAALVSLNSAEALEDIALCRATAGLHLVTAQNGGSVCTGSESAKRGWRVPARLMQ